MDIQNLFRENTASGTYNAVNLGAMLNIDILKTCEVRFTENTGKRATFVFKNDKGLMLTIPLSKKLQEQYSEGKVSKTELLSCEVIKMDIVDQATGTVTAKDVLLLQARGTGWANFGATVKDIAVVQKITMDTLAGF